MNIDTETGDNWGTIVSGQNPGQNPVINASHTIYKTSSTSVTTTPVETTVTSKESESDQQKTVIIATTVTSCFVVLILIYFVIIRPYLRRKIEKDSNSPIDTSRAPMDLEFRNPKKKKWFQDWFEFFVANKFMQ